MKIWKIANNDRQTRFIYSSLRYNWWLKNYTHDQNSVGYPAPEIWNKLLEKYPFNRGGKLYRGLIFFNKAKWEDFQKNISSGTLTINHVSSWFKETHKDGAFQFAVTSPTYTPNPFTMQSYFGSRDRKEILEGYRGAIISTTVDPSVIGIDVDKSKFYKEPGEVILPEGTYAIQVVQVIKQFSEMIENNEVNVDNIVSNASAEELNQATVIGEDFKKGLLDNILSFHLDKLSSTTIKGLYDKMFIEPPYWKVRIEEGGTISANIGESSLIHKRYILPYLSSKFFTIGFSGVFDEHPFIKNEFSTAIREVLEEWLDICKNNMDSVVDQWRHFRSWAEKYGHQDLISEFDSIIDFKFQKLEYIYKNNSLMKEYFSYKTFFDNWWKTHKSEPTEKEQDEYDMKTKQLWYNQNQWEISGINSSYERDKRQLQNMKV